MHMQITMKLLLSVSTGSEPPPVCTGRRFMKPLMLLIIEGARLFEWYRRQSTPANYLQIANAPLIHESLRKM